MRALIPLIVLLAPLLASPARAAPPLSDPAGPEAAAYGQAQDYPPPDRPGGNPPQDRMVGFYSHYDQVNRLHAVPTAGPPSPLRRGDLPAALLPTLDAYLDRTPATGLLIARGDTILYERYRYARSDTDRFLSQSMAKTITGLLVGIAIHEGRIRSIDDPAATYVPELANTEYGATPLRALLHMSSGVEFRETYQPGDDNDRLGRALFGSGGTVAALRQFNTRVAAPGEKWHYAGSETELLGLVVARATGTTLADYLSTRIWAPMGMEADAAWLPDRAGQELAYCCFVARLRDWARLGLMLAHDGQWNGRQIVPRDWLHDTTTTTADAPYARGRISGGRGYGYQLWLVPGGRSIALIGIHGQRMLIDPDQKLVLVQTAVFVPAGGPAQNEIYPLWQMLRAQLP